MEKELLLLLEMKLLTQGTGKMDLEMVLDRLYLKVEQIMMESLKVDSSMDLEKCFTQKN